MHVLRNTTAISLPDKTVLPPGEWLLQDEHAFFYGMAADKGSVSVMPFMSAIDASVEGKWPASILLIRSGAIGDLLLLSPCIEPLKKKYLGTEIFLCCAKKHWPIMSDMTPLIDYPIPLSASRRFDLIIPLEHIVELSTERGEHATDAFAEALGVTVTDYRPMYHVLDTEADWVSRQFPKQDNTTNTWKKRIALQLRASSPIRDYPIAQWQIVITTLFRRGWEVMLIGQQDGVKGGLHGLIDCSKLSFREAAAVLSTCNVFCGIDSAFFNLCPALGVPAIGLFGPVGWRTRIKPGSGQIALSGVADCAPCGWTNSRAGRRWPEGAPCGPAGHCVPLSEITPERIVAVIEREAKK